MRHLWNARANSHHSAPGFLPAVYISIRSRECCNNPSQCLATTFNSFELYMFVHLHFSNMGVSIVLNVASVFQTPITT